jgi:hypothetical protein
MTYKLTAQWGADYFGNDIDFESYEECLECRERLISEHIEEFFDEQFEEAMKEAREDVGIEVREALRLEAMNAIKIYELKETQ